MLANRIEGKGDQRLVGGAGFLRMLQCSLQQFTADATPLISGGHEQFGKKPQVAADPTEGEAKHLTGIFSDP
jgi:hypothetical protein